jgi:hypothetical protein
VNETEAIYKGTMDEQFSKMDERYVYKFKRKKRKP